MTAPARSSNRTLRIVSKCATKAEFVAVFRRLVSNDAVFIATRKPKSKGDSVRFRITLSDSTPMLVGQGKVVTSDSDGTGPFGRPGMQIALSELDDASRSTLSLLKQKAPSPPAARPPAPKQPPPKKTLFAALPPIPPVAAQSKSKAPKPRALPPLLKPDAVAAPEKKPRTLPANDWLSKPKGPEIDPLPQEKQKRPVNQRFVARGTPPPVLAKHSQPAEAKAPAPAPTKDAPEADEPDDTVRVDHNAANEATLRAPAPAQDAAPAQDSAPAETERTKGSDYILPANPFGELAKESLEAFVECTLYEETGNFAPIREDSEPTESGHTPIPNWWPGGNTPPPVFDRSPAIADETTVTESLAELVRGNTSEQSAAALPLEPPAATEPPGPPSFPPPAQLAAAHAAPVAAPNYAAPSTPVPSPIPQHVAVDATALIDTRPVWKRTAVIVGSTAVFSLVAGYLLWGGGDEEAAQESASKAPTLAVAPASKDKSKAQAPDEAASNSATSAAAKKAPAEPVEPETAPEEKAPTPTEPETAPEEKAPTPTEPETAPEEKAPTPTEPENTDAATKAVVAPTLTSASGQCPVSFSTRPKGASIYSGATKLGVTPFEAELPCGEQELTIKRSRYIDLKRTINTSQDKELSLRLERPTHTLRVVSKPAGATVYVYGRRIGRTPTRTKVQGFERIPIKLVRKGYKTYATKRYMRRAKTTVSVALTKNRPPRRARKTRRRSTKRSRNQRVRNRKRR